MVFHVGNITANINYMFIYSPIFYKVSRKWVNLRVGQDNPTIIMKRVEFENLKPVKYYSTYGFNTELKEKKVSSLKMYQ